MLHGCQRACTGRQLRAPLVGLNRPLKQHNVITHRHFLTYLALSLGPLLAPLHWAHAQQTQLPQAPQKLPTAPAIAPPFDPTETLRHQEERIRAVRQREEASADTPALAFVATHARLPRDEMPCFPLRELRLKTLKPDGLTTSNVSFEWALQASAGPDDDDSPIGQCVGERGIALVMQRVQQAIIQRGFITTKVLAHQQDLRTGVLTLSVVAGHVSRIQFETGGGHTPPRNAFSIQAGDLLNIRDIEQALENLKRVPTVEADIQIEALENSETPYDSVLVVHYQQTKPLRVSATLDDGGSKNTGVYQASTTLSWDNPLALSDLLYLTSSHDAGGGHPGRRGTQGHTLHYSIPIHSWTLSSTHSSNRYLQQVTGLAQDYNYHGSSENTELKLEKLLHRSSVRKTTVHLRAWQRRSNSFIDDTEVLVQRRAVGGWELGLGHKDAFGTTAVDGQLTLRRGTGDFDSIPAPEEAFNEGTSKMGVITLDLQASRPFKAWGQMANYKVALRVQDNTTPLTPQDRFAIGGRYSVRGFDGESSLSAERGWTLRNDWSVALGTSGQDAYLGVDAGEVTGKSAEYLTSNTLTGAVIGLRGTYRKLQFDVFVGAPLYQPPGFRTLETTAGFSLSLRF